MRRYQFHLDSTSVQVIDEVAKFYDLTRSELLRSVLDKITSEYRQMVRVLANTKMLKAPISKTWLDMCGAGKTTARNVSLNVDDIYLRDSTDA